MNASNVGVIFLISADSLVRQSQQQKQIKRSINEE
jgi:hypothetical protein